MLQTPHFGHTGIGLGKQAYFAHLTRFLADASKLLQDKLGEEGK